MRCWPRRAPACPTVPARHSGRLPILPIGQMQEMGVCVSLGCDGSATNDSSSLLDSMRTAWMMQAWHSKGHASFP